jgi:hypothetical protein
MVEATGIELVACDRGSRCVEYAESPVDPELLCLGATPVAACTTTDEVGRCVRRDVGGTIITTYHRAPLPPDVTLASLELECSTPILGTVGVWSMP